MKIVYIIDAHVIHTQRFAEFFADRGHKVYIITYFIMGDFDSQPNIQIHKIRVPKIIQLLPYKYSYANIMRVRKLIHKINPDIVHGHYISSSGLYTILSGNYPKVLSAWGSDIFVDCKRSRIIKFVVELALRYADIITSTSKTMKTELMNMFGIDSNKIHAFSWGIDLGLFHRDYTEEVKGLKENLKISENSPVILSSRHMKPVYRIHHLIDTIPEVIKYYPECVFILLKGWGITNYEDEIKLKANKLGIIDNIRFVSKQLTPEEMVVYLNASHIMVSIPSSDQFSACLLEGMACGVIPIVSNLEVYKERLVDKENAFFVNPENPKEIAERIIYCIEHPELKEKFFEINRKIIEEKDDWNKNAKKMEELYEKLLNARIHK
jgi:glycosyltransferase involved in cell wall biosynthesis